ncbi:hypothetical protein Bca4012_072533 [Brassica carinata]
MNSLEEKFNHLVTGITRTRRVEAASSYSLKLVGLSEIKAGSNVRSYMNQMYLLLQGINAQFIELSTLKDQKNGYAVKDTCTFGVDIAILKPAEKLETVTFLHNPPNNKFTWKIFHFSNLSDQEFVLSDQFLAGQRYCGDRGHGVPKLITQKDLYDKSKGFLVKDTIILEVEMLCMSQTQVISK